MLGLVVASEVAKALGYDLTVLFKARILSGLTVVASLVKIEVWDISNVQYSKTARKTALQTSNQK